MAYFDIAPDKLPSCIYFPLVYYGPNDTPINLYMEEFKNAVRSIYRFEK